MNNETAPAILYESRNVPAPFRAWCDTNANAFARIRAVDYGPGYSHPDTGRDCHAYNILLRRGWSTEETGLHTIIEPTATAAKRQIREATPCNCAECSTSTHGGTRAGAGRKAIDPDGTLVVTMRLTATQKATLTMLGGARWLRAQLDAAATEPKKQ